MDTKQRALNLLVELEAVREAIKADKDAKKAIETLQLIASTLCSAQHLAEIIVKNKEAA